MQYDQENISKSETIIKLQENRLEYLHKDLRVKNGHSASK